MVTKLNFFLIRNEIYVEILADWRYKIHRYIFLGGFFLTVTNSLQLLKSFLKRYFSSEQRNLVELLFLGSLNEIHFALYMTRFSSEKHQQYFKMKIIISFDFCFCLHRKFLLNNNENNLKSIYLRGETTRYFSKQIQLTRQIQSAELVAFQKQIHFQELFKYIIIMYFLLMQQNV